MQTKISQQKLMYLIQKIYQIHQLTLTHFCLHFRTERVLYMFLITRPTNFTGVKQECFLSISRVKKHNVKILS